MADALFEDTVAAVATPPGRGAIAVVRVTGAGSDEVLRRVCPSLAVSLPPPRTQHLAAVHHPDTGELLDRCLVTRFAAPRSYTGEDGLEISTHGGALTPHLVLGAVLAAGARPAEPGEFTRRAVYHGKMDVIQAEAVADLIDGRSPALHRAAIHQLERGLTRRIEALRREVLRLQSLIGYGIDFPEEDEPPVSAERITAAAESVLASIDLLLGTAPQGEMLRDGALVVLAGRPNSGKSSLFNALVGAERAIVTEVPGTTRDAIEAAVAVDGYPFHLIDTAGLRQSDDPVEGLGIEVARRYLDAADVVLFCTDASLPLDAEETLFLRGADPGRTVRLLTKADLVPDGSRPAPDASLTVLPVSSHSGEGLAGLRAELLRIAFGGILGDAGEQPLVTRERHARALRSARDEVEAFLVARSTQVPPEFAVTHLIAAAAALELLIGAITPDDVLGGIFESFCVGK